MCELLTIDEATKLLSIVRGAVKLSPEERKVLERALGHSVLQRREVDESSRT